jgi:hypothetical protein
VGARLILARRSTLETPSARKRKRIEECFGWLKTIALLRRVRHRGIFKGGWNCSFAAAAYNLVHMRNLAIQAVEVKIVVSAGPKKDLLSTSRCRQSSSLNHKLSNLEEDRSRIIGFPQPTRTWRSQLERPYRPLSPRRAGRASAPRRPDTVAHGFRAARRPG